MKKILLTGLGDKLGGTESFLRVLVDGLGGEYEFSVLAATNRQFAMADFLASHHVPVYQLHGIFGLKSALRRGKVLDRFFANHSFDLVHVNANTINAAYIARAAVRAGIHVVFQIHNAAPSGYSALAQLLTKLNTPRQRYFLRRQNVTLIAVSDEAATRVFGSRLKSKARVIENGIETARFKFEPTRRELIRNKLSIRGDARLGISISRLMPIKNIDRTIKIFSKAYGAQLDNLVIVGEGPEQGHLEAVVKELPRTIQKNIIFAGQQSHPEDYLAAGDVFFALSTAEGLSISVIEAEASGLPVIASTGIPPITNVTGRVRYVPLSAPEKTWLSELSTVMLPTEMDYRSQRLADNQSVKASPFSDEAFLERFRMLYH